MGRKGRVVELDWAAVQHVEGLGRGFQVFRMGLKAMLRYGCRGRKRRSTCATEQAARTMARLSTAMAAGILEAGRPTTCMEHSRSQEALSASAKQSQGKLSISVEQCQESPSTFARQYQEAPSTYAKEYQEMRSTSAK